MKLRSRRLFEDILPRLIRPNAWSMNMPLNWDWDEYVNTMLDLGVVTDDDGYTAQCGHTRIWVSNWPYAYGYLYTVDTGRDLPQVRTTYRTARRLRAELKEREKGSETQRLRDFLNRTGEI